MISETDSSYYYSEEEEEIGEPEKWIECVVDKDYEISNKYPYNIRRKGTKRNISIKADKYDGYLKCNLNRKHYKHHRIVALQFIPNDNPEKTQVDHINRIRTDNHISNLRWATPAENSQNRGYQTSFNGIPFIFTNEIDKEAIRIEKYGNRELENYYYDFNLDQFYHREEDGKYRLLNVLHRKDGFEFVYMWDKNNVRFELRLNVFKADL